MNAGLAFWLAFARSKVITNLNLSYWSIFSPSMAYTCIRQHVRYSHSLIGASIRFIEFDDEWSSFSLQRQRLPHLAPLYPNGAELLLLLPFAAFSAISTCYCVYIYAWAIYICTDECRYQPCFQDISKSTSNIVILLYILFLLSVIIRNNIEKGNTGSKHAMMHRAWEHKQYG